MPYEFRPAVREQTSLLVAFAGPSGSGKTFSALAFAEGLAAGGKIAFIDTEAGRALHYADRFKFDHCELRPPFRPEAYTEVIAAAEQGGYRVIVIDSMSHEYEGDGGIQDWAAELEAKGTKAPGNWKVPKLAHKRMVSRLLQCRSHLVFCLRAEEKIKIERGDNGKTVIVPIGWQPLCEKRFMYEMTASFLLKPDYPGIPHPIKLQDQHRAAFPSGKQVGREAGEALAAWAGGGAEPKKAADEDLYQSGMRNAEQGTEALRVWFESLSRDRKLLIKGRLQTLKDVAELADSRGDDLSFDGTEGGADGQAASEQQAAA